MSGSRSRPSPAERALESLQSVRENPYSPESHAKLRTALAGTLSLVVAKGAKIVAENELQGFAPDLDAAFRRFLANDAKADPGCQAKVALLEALDRTDSQVPDPFLLALRCFQPEGGFGPVVDSADRVRGRGILALARIGVDDLGLLAAELLADPAPAVREAAAEAIEASGNRAYAGVLRLKLSVGDAEDSVSLACLAGLVALAPQSGLPLARDYLTGTAAQSEIASLALGQSHSEDALNVLLDALKGVLLPSQRALVVRALGFHRSERGLAALLTLIAEGARREATAAVSALAPRALESGLRARVEEAARRNTRVDLEAVVRETFPA